MRCADQRYFTAFVLAAVFSAPIAAQTSGEVAQAVRTGRRAADEFRRQSEEAAYAASQSQLATALAETLVADRICKPMWKQNTITRREYIERITKKRSERRAVTSICYANELSMYGFCSPKEWGDYQGTYIRA